MSTVAESLLDSQERKREELCIIGAINDQVGFYMAQMLNDCYFNIKKNASAFVTPSIPTMSLSRLCNTIINPNAIYKGCLCFDLHWTRSLATIGLTPCPSLSNIRHSLNGEACLTCHIFQQVRGFPLQTYPDRTENTLAHTSNMLLICWGGWLTLAIVSALGPLPAAAGLASWESVDLPLSS